MKNQQYQYLCLVEELRKRLQDGELQSGSAIPSEAELAKALSLSKREVRPLLKNLEIAGILSGSRDGTYTLAKEMSDSMRELMHVMFLVQNISPYEDCCTIFVAKHPVTKPNLNVIKCSERHLDDVIDEMMERAVSTAETIEVC